MHQFAIGDTLTWNEVSSVHKARNGIYQINGHLVSLLTDFGKINPCYPDFHGDDRNVIFYTGSGRRGDQKMDMCNQALHAAIVSRQAVPLFNKIAVNKWQYLGNWFVTEASYVRDEGNERMVWKFRLQQTA